MTIHTTAQQQPAQAGNSIIAERKRATEISALGLRPSQAIYDCPAGRRIVAQPGRIGPIILPFQKTDPTIKPWHQTTSLRIPCQL